MGVNQTKCSRQFSLTSSQFSLYKDIIVDSVAPYNEPDEGKFKTVVKFDCRGMEPCDFSPRNGWVVEGFESGTKFPDVDLTEKEWADYDEKAATTVGIYELEHKFIREK